MITDAAYRPAASALSDPFATVLRMSRFRLDGSKLLAITVDGAPVRALNGSMVAYEGQMEFKKQSFGGAGIGGALKRAATGESLSLMEIRGSGICYVAAAAQNVCVVELAGDTLFVEASSILALDGSLETGIEMTGPRGMQAGTGLFTTRVSGQGEVAFVSDGPAIGLRVAPGAPVTVDPQAYVAHRGRLQQQFLQDVNVRTVLGQGSGETFQQRFDGDGVVYIQPAERAGGIGGNL